MTAVFDTTFKNKTISGSTFTGAPYYEEVYIAFSKEILSEYIPTIEKVKKDDPRVFRLLLTIMTQKEGFYKGTKSYKNNNPSNIKNINSGEDEILSTLEEGIILQRQFVLDILEGRNKNFLINSIINIKPFFSETIAKNFDGYKISPWLPGYRFVFNGQLDQFVKLFSPESRGSNNYINMMVSFFRDNEITINPQTKIQDIIKIE
jgi:hypothetical protein